MVINNTNILIKLIQCVNSTQSMIQAVKNKINVHISMIKLINNYSLIIYGICKKCMIHKLDVTLKPKKFINIID
jgi:hypothetical protein